MSVKNGAFQPVDEECSVVVVGAGVGGLAFAAHLVQKWGKDVDFVVYERATDVGGTWRANVYPGCSCDVPVHFYSLSKELNPDWTLTHPFNPEILAYWKKIISKYNLAPHLSFQSNVLSATWNPDTSRYHLVVQSLSHPDKPVKHVTAKILVSALGVLEVPNRTNLRGLDTFKGRQFHSAQWDYSVDLKGKKVAVIGNGATSTQFVPCLTEEPSTQITQFCRTPNWFLPPIRAEFPPYFLWVLRNVPFALKIYRFRCFMTTELFYAMIFGNKLLHRFSTWLARTYIRRTAPKEYLKDLLPSYKIGCKRVIFDTDYLKCLHKPNIRLNYDGIEEIVENGIKTKKGEVISADVLILGTGFAADRFPLPIDAEGRSIQSYYDTQGGPTAYMGTTVPHFPNLFILGGPNTTTGHTSVLYTEEIQTDYTLQCIEPILFPPKSGSGEKTKIPVAVEVTPEASDKYNEVLQRRLSSSVFMSCMSWYRVDGTGKVNSIFPGSGTLFWLWLRKVKWGDYLVKYNSGEVVNGKQLCASQKRRTKTIEKVILLLLLLGIGMSAKYRFDSRQIVTVRQWIEGVFRSR